MRFKVDSLPKFFISKIRVDLLEWMRNHRNKITSYLPLPPPFFVRFINNKNSKTFPLQTHSQKSLTHQVLNVFKQVRVQYFTWLKNCAKLSYFSSRVLSVAFYLSISLLRLSNCIIYYHWAFCFGIDNKKK